MKDINLLTTEYAQVNIHNINKYLTFCDKKIIPLRIH